MSVEFEAADDVLLGGNDKGWSVCFVVAVGVFVCEGWMSFWIREWSDSLESGLHGMRISYNDRIRLLHDSGCPFHIKQQFPTWCVR